MSGSSPKRPLANHAPHRPNPVITSSATKSTPVSRHTARAADRYPWGAGYTPPAPITGSQKNAATLSSPTCSIIERRSSASSQRTCTTSSISSPWPRGVRGDPGEARARGVHPVVRAFAPDQDRPFGLSDQLPEPACHLRRRVDRVGAAARQEHAAVGDGGERADTFRQLGRRTVREVPERGVRGERRHLGGGGIGDVAPPEPDVGEPEARGRVQVATSRLVPDVRAVPAHQDELAVGGDRRHVGERMPEVGHVAEATSGDVGAQVDGTSRARRPLSPCRTPGSGAASAPPRRCSRRGGARSPPAGPSRSCPR